MQVFVWLFAMRAQVTFQKLSEPFNRIYSIAVEYVHILARFELAAEM